MAATQAEVLCRPREARMKTCLTCQQPFEPTEAQLAKKAQLMKTFPKFGETFPRCCLTCQELNMIKALRMLLEEALEEAIEQGDSVGEGRL